MGSVTGRVPSSRAASGSLGCPRRRHRSRTACQRHPTAPATPKRRRCRRHHRCRHAVPGAGEWRRAVAAQSEVAKILGLHDHRTRHPYRRRRRGSRCLRRRCRRCSQEIRELPDRPSPPGYVRSASMITRVRSLRTDGPAADGGEGRSIRRGRCEAAQPGPRWSLPTWRPSTKAQARAGWPRGPPRTDRPESNGLSVNVVRCHKTRTRQQDAKS